MLAKGSCWNNRDTLDDKSYVFFIVFSYFIGPAFLVLVHIVHPRNNIPSSFPYSKSSTSRAKTQSHLSTLH
jgi:hypothetical protein